MQLHAQKSQRSKKIDTKNLRATFGEPYFFWWEVVRLVQKTAMITTTTMVMTPTETMMTSSILLSRGEVGLPWGLLLPREGRKVCWLVLENSKNAYNQAVEASCIDTSRELLYNTHRQALYKCLINMAISSRLWNLESWVFALWTFLSTVPCTKVVFNKGFWNYTEHYTEK